MKARILAATSTLAIAFVANTVTAGISDVEAYKKILSSVPKLEMPAKAAQEVRKATASRQQVAKDVIAAAVAISPMSAPAVVRAISRVAPEVGMTAMAFATALKPDQAAVIIAAVPIVSASPAGPSMSFGPMRLADGGPTFEPLPPVPFRGPLPPSTIIIVAPGGPRNYTGSF